MELRPKISLTHSLTWVILSLPHLLEDLSLGLGLEYRALVLLGRAQAHQEVRVVAAAQARPALQQVEGRRRVVVARTRSFANLGD